MYRLLDSISRDSLKLQSLVVGNRSASKLTWHWISESKHSGAPAFHNKVN